MPTENRSSNTEQMVSVPRALLERACMRPSKESLAANHQDIIERGQAQAELRDLLSQPVAQRQSEPVAVLYESGHVLTKAECGNVFDICCKVETPLFTHADTGEVERLARKCQNADLALKVQTQNSDTLREKLAERDALLADIARRHWSGIDFDLPADLVARIKGLSASTEPAPTSSRFSAEQMAAQGADGYRNGIKAAAELAEAYPELAQAIRDMPLPQ